MKFHIITYSLNSIFVVKLQQSFTSLDAFEADMGERCGNNVKYVKNNSVFWTIKHESIF